LSDATTQTATRTFRVLIDDFFHYMDEEYRVAGPRFSSYEEAVAWCRVCVDSSLKNCYEPGMSVDDLLAKYKRYGDDPFVIPQPAGAPPWSAWSYAAAAARRICSR